MPFQFDPTHPSLKLRRAGGFYGGKEHEKLERLKKV